MQPDLVLASSFSKTLETIQSYGVTMPSHKQYWLAYTLDTCQMDQDATFMEVDIWKAAAINFCCEHGVSHQTINLIKTMAGYISALSASERVDAVNLNSFAKV